MLWTLVRTLARRIKRVGSTRLHSVWEIAALLVVAALATALPVVLASEAQTIAVGTKSSIPSSGNPQNGNLVFKSQSCDKCHGSQGEGLSASGTNSGVLPLASTTLTLPNFIQLVRKPKGRMPPYGSHQVSDVELTDVYAFLQSQTTLVGHAASVATDTKTGQRLFAKYGCYECHLSQGQGARTTGVRLAHPQIPLSAFISYIRAPIGEMPPYTDKTISDQELTKMYAFLQSVPQAPSWKAIPLLNQ